MVTGSSGYCTVHFPFGIYDSVTPIPWMIALVDSITSLIIDIDLRVSSSEFRVQSSASCLLPPVSCLLSPAFPSLYWRYHRTRSLPATVPPHKLIDEPKFPSLILKLKPHNSCQGCSITE